MKNILLYFTLFLLIILLLLPPGLRLFGKNLYTTPIIPKNKDVLEILNCTKINETISTSFLNGKAYNIKYEISGNHLSQDNENSLLNTEETDNVNKNTIVDDLNSYAEVKYIEEKNITEFRLAVNLLNNIPDSLVNYTKSIQEVSNYYTDLSFSCTIQKY